MSREGEMDMMCKCTYTHTYTQSLTDVTNREVLIKGRLQHQKANLRWNCINANKGLWSRVRQDGSECYGVWVLQFAINTRNIWVLQDEYQENLSVTGCYLYQEHQSGTGAITIRNIWLLQDAIYTSNIWVLQYAISTRKSECYSMLLILGTSECHSMLSIAGTSECYRIPSMGRKIWLLQDAINTKNI